MWAVENWKSKTRIPTFPPPRLACGARKKAVYTKRLTRPQNAGLISQRGCGDETAVPGVGAYCQEVDDAGAELESGLAALCDSARRPRPARRAGIALSRGPTTAASRG